MKSSHLVLIVAAIVGPLSVGCGGGSDSNQAARGSGSKSKPLEPPKAPASEYGADGFHIRTGRDRDGYDREGFNVAGRDRQGYDKNGFNADPQPLHKDTGSPYNPEGFNSRGYNRFGEDRSGSADPTITYGANGFNQYGFDRAGFDAQGRYAKTNELRDPEGFDVKGFDKLGFDRKGLDEHGFDRKHVHSITGKPRDEQGFDYMGFDKNGFGRDGRHKDTGTLFNKAGYNRDGFDKRGFDEKGLHKLTGSRRDPSGYDREGYDKSGFNRDGFDKKGYDRSGKASFYRLVADLIQHKIEDNPPPKQSEVALVALKEIGRWFGVTDQKPKTIFKKMTMLVHPDKCKKAENFDNIEKLTRGKGFPEDEKLCSELFRFARELQQIAK